MILPGNLPTAIDEAARALQRGALLGLPTETVYGLAADADNDAAVAAIFAAKGRPSNHPLIVHVADAGAITRFAKEVPLFAQQLIDAFWPGPLTLILPRRTGMVAAAHGGAGQRGAALPFTSGCTIVVASLCAIATTCLGRGRAQRQPLRPREPDHGRACAKRIRRRAAGS